MHHFARRLAALATILALGATPAFAGTAETAFLTKLAGSWSGAGTLSGSESGKLTCKMSFTATAKGVSFKGKCDTDSFGPQSFSGTLAYNESAKQYEATSKGETTIGVKSGKSVVFTSKLKSIAGAGTSVMKLSASRVVIDVAIKRAQSNNEIKSHVEMAK
ncbi:MAG: hypothetical protein ABIQ30_15525 [Devosia sp.]